MRAKKGQFHQPVNPDPEYFYAQEDAEKAEVKANAESAAKQSAKEHADYIAWEDEYVRSHPMSTSRGGRYVSERPPVDPRDS